MAVIWRGLVLASAAPLRVIGRSTVSRTATIAVAFMLVGGCSADRNETCEWPPDTGASLTDDVHLAEDLAVRYADAQGHREDWRVEREACEAKLFRAINTRHNSTLAEIANIRQGFTRCRPDLPVYGPMFGLCALAAWWLARGVTRRCGLAHRHKRISWMS